MKKHGKLILSLLALAVYIVFNFLPATDALSTTSFQVLGIFLATMILWLGVSITWPTLFCLTALALTPLYTGNSVFSTAYSIWVPSFVLFSSLICYALSKTGFLRRVAIWLITRPFARKRPWAFVTMLCLSPLIIGMFMDQIALYAIMLPLTVQIFDELGVKDLHLEINSIGCPKCRAEYHKALKEYFTSRIDELCDTCRDRLDRNPMRILDCKSPVCSEIAKDAPVVLDYLCDECREHFEKTKSYLDASNIEYIVNPQIVRGLDYYTKTVFEFVSDSIGSQGTVCGGGRYDGLIEELGGQHTPSLGFGMGLERLQLVMEAQGCEFPEPSRPDLFIVAMGDKATLKAIEIAKDMRDEGYSVVYDLNGRSLRAQMKYADKCNAKYNVVIGDNEVDTKTAILKDMATGEQSEISLETFVSGYYSITLDSQLKDLEINGEAFDFNSLFLGGQNDD